MADFSPAAQAVLDAGREYATQAWSNATHQRFNLGIAAAIRAAADQVVPETNNMFISPAELQQEKTRDQLLAIAAELEALPSG